MKPLKHGAFAMPLQRGEVQGYDFNRTVVEFTMLNQGNVILCAISTAALWTPAVPNLQPSYFS
jgi:hypothetical protein